MPTQNNLMSKSSTLNHINYVSNFNHHPQQRQLTFAPDVNNNNTTANGIPFYGCNASQSLLCLSAMLGGGGGQNTTNASMSNINEAAVWNKAVGGRPIRGGTAASFNSLNTVHSTTGNSSSQSGFYQTLQRKQPSQWPTTVNNNLELNLNAVSRNQHDGNNSSMNDPINHQTKWANSLLMPANSEANRQHQLEMLRLKQRKDEERYQSLLMTRLQLELQLKQHQMQMQRSSEPFGSSLSSSTGSAGDFGYQTSSSYSESK
jgi:hypothetical protein